MAILFSLARVRNHCDLLVMVLGAGAQLFSSVFLYKILTPTDYGLYSLLLTYIATVFSFGLFGLEQTFLRLCVVRRDSICVSKSLAILISLGLFVGPASLAILAKLFFLRDVSVVSLYCIALMSAYLMFVYNYKRISGEFITSQLINNLWKIGIFLPLPFCRYVDITFEFLLIIILLMLFLCSIFSLYHMYVNKVTVLSYENDNLSRVLSLSGSFLFSMGTLTILSFFDRYLISVKFDVEIFGEYFFMVNIFAYPFSFFANYYGFRKLVQYKNKFYFKIFKQKLILLIIEVTLIGCCYIVVAIGCIPFFLSNFVCFLDLMVPLVVFGCTKVIYSNLSAAMGARGEGIYIYLSNLIVLSLSILFGVTVFFLGGGIVLIAWLMVLLWLVRSMLYYYSIGKFVNEI